MGKQFAVCTNPTVLRYKDRPIPSVSAHCEGPSWNRVPTLKPHRWPFPFAIPRLLSCLVIWLCSTKWSEVSGSCTQTVFSLAFLLGRPAPRDCHILNRPTGPYWNLHVPSPRLPQSRSRDFLVCNQRGQIGLRWLIKSSDSALLKLC